MLTRFFLRIFWDENRYISDVMCVRVCVCPLRCCVIYPLYLMTVQFGHTPRCEWPKIHHLGKKEKWLTVNSKNRRNDTVLCDLLGGHPVAHIINYSTCFLINSFRGN